MENSLQEQACWLSLVFECGLTTRNVNDILVLWCKQLKRTLHDFFAADAQEWSTACRLKPEIIQKLEQGREKLVGQAFFVERLQQEHIQMLTVFDERYPRLLKSALKRSKIPPLLFYMGDLDILTRQTIAIIGARNAGETALAFSQSSAAYFASHEANVISGLARGVDRAAYEGATGASGYTTAVLPHGIRKLSKAQMRALLPHINAGKVLLLSQFHPDASWLVSRAMERNTVVTGLAQVVVVAEADSKGGTWEGANGALAQGRRLYVREPGESDKLPGNALLLQKGGKSLPWPAAHFETLLGGVLQEGKSERKRQAEASLPPDQLSLLILSSE